MTDSPHPPAGARQIVTDVSVTVFAWNDVPLVSYSDRNPAATGQSELGLVTLRTNDGIEGHAFLGSSIRGAELDVVSLVRNLSPRVLGADPLERERLWRDLHSVSRATTMRAIGAMDIALWDIAGKLAGLPDLPNAGLVPHQDTRLCQFPSVCRGR